MLFVLTGDVQIGKTRWLQALTHDLCAKGVLSCGVVAPGVWKPLAEGETEREKLGIDNLLLPQEKLIRFARRNDLAQQEGVFNAASQSAQAGLKWEIDDAAIEEVNAHFAALSKVADREGVGTVAARQGFSTPSTPFSSGGFLVVDELGRLELLGDKGLTEAVALLDRGPTPLAEHALIVVRDWFADAACERFSGSWPDIRRISPDDTARDEILSFF
ncbi:MAG: hypothetical protein RR381_03535 [Raoultibacter sp.]